MNYHEEIAKIIKHYKGKDIMGMHSNEASKWIWSVLTDLIEEVAELRIEDE